MTAIGEHRIGESLAIHRTPLESATREILTVLNWFDELQRLVPIP